jgi:hypothetical protein
LIECEEVYEIIDALVTEHHASLRAAQDGAQPGHRS